MEMPLYYLANIEQVKSNVGSYFEECVPSSLNLLLACSNEIIRDTFRMAKDFSSERYCAILHAPNLFALTT